MVEVNERADTATDLEFDASGLLYYNLFLESQYLDPAIWIHPVSLFLSQRQSFNGLVRDAFQRCPRKNVLQMVLILLLFDVSHTDLACTIG